MLAREDPHSSYRLLANELVKRQYAIRDYMLGDIHILEATSSRGRRWLTPISHISYPMQSAFFKQISTCKDLAYQLMEDANIPVPFTRVVGEGEEIPTSEIVSMLTNYSSLVVKPSNSSLSRGLTLFITDEKKLRQAIAYARKCAKNGLALIQEQVAGEEIRFVYLNGVVHAALLRETAKVWGDGTSSVSELIEQENTIRKRIYDTMVSYPLLTSEMIGSQIDMELIPTEGQLIELNRSTMIRGGASIFNVIDRIDASYVDLVTRAAESAGTAFAVVDMMLEDYTRPFSGKNAVFNEFNSAPVLKLCYSCRDGKQFDIVPKLVDAIDKRIHV